MKKLLEKEKQLNLLLFKWPNAEYGLRRAAPGLRPDSQWVDHQSSPLRSPTWALFSPGRRRALSAVGSDPTAGRDPRGIKIGDAGLSRNPSGSFSLPLLSPRDAAATATGHGGRAERAGRRRRGLLAGARARQRVSAPPSSRPWTEPRFRAPHTRPRCPGAASGRLHCAAKSGERRRRCVTRTGDSVACGPGKSRTL